MGREIAIRLARAGANIVVFTRTRSYAEEVCDEIRSLGREALMVIGDVTANEDITRMVKATLNKFERIDILVNNAGRGDPHSSFLDIKEKDWDDIVDLNLKSVFLCSSAVVEQMIKQKGGKIINIASVVGKTGTALQPDYSAAKFGVIGFTQSLAKELAKYNINVNAVCPGWTDTPGLDRWCAIYLKFFPSAGKNVETFKKELAKKIPLGRLVTPRDVANVVMFLASDESNLMTGQAINICGGEELH